MFSKIKDLNKIRDSRVDLGGRFFRPKPEIGNPGRFRAQVFWRLLMIRIPMEVNLQ